MFTKAFTLDRHIEELRAELRGTFDIEEAHGIKTELEAMLMMREDLIGEAKAKD